MTERIVLTRWGPGTAAAALLIAGVLAAGPLLALLDADTHGERVVLGTLSAVFGAPLIWTLWRIPKAMRGMGIIVDSHGIHEFDGGHTTTIPWTDVDRVGFGAYSRRYRGLTTRSPSAFEVYRTGRPDPVIRCALSPFATTAETLENAVKRIRPDLWAGPFTHSR